LIAGVAMTFLAGLARVYYGVHSSLQVACGWALGIALVIAASRLERPLASWWSGATPSARWLAATLPALLLFAGGLALRAWLGARFEIPVEWVERHRATAVELDPADAAELLLFDPSLLARWSGALLGASLAAAWWASPRRSPLEIGSWRQRLIHTVVGAGAALAVIESGRALVLAAGELELVRFAVLMWVLGVGAPSLAEAIHRRLGGGRR
jgi:hypothetical protein